MSRSEPEPGPAGFGSEPADPRWSDPAWTAGPELPAVEAAEREAVRASGGPLAAGASAMAPARRARNRGWASAAILIGFVTLVAARWTYVEVAYHRLESASPARSGALAQLGRSPGERIDACSQRLAELERSCGKPRPRGGTSR